MRKCAAVGYDARTPTWKGQRNLASGGGAPVETIASTLCPIEIMQRGRLICLHTMQAFIGTELGDNPNELGTPGAQTPPRSTSHCSRTLSCDSVAALPMQREE